MSCRQLLPPMTDRLQSGTQARRPIQGLRWWIGGLLFTSTVINYLDRQTLSLLAPFLKIQYHWTNSDYANLLMVFASHMPSDKRHLAV